MCGEARRGPSEPPLQVEEGLVLRHWAATGASSEAWSRLRGPWRAPSLSWARSCPRCTSAWRSLSRAPAMRCSSCSSSPGRGAPENSSAGRRPLEQSQTGTPGGPAASPHPHPRLGHPQREWWQRWQPRPAPAGSARDTPSPRPGAPMSSPPGPAGAASVLLRLLETPGDGWGWAAASYPQSHSALWDW